MTEFVPVTRPDPPSNDEAEPVHTSAVEPVEVDDDDSRGERVPVGEQQQGRSIPAGHLLIGALSTLVLGGWALWEWLGTAGLLWAGGAVAATGGGYGYLRHRRSIQGRAHDLVSSLGLGRRSGGRAGRDPLTGSGGAGRVGRKMAFGPQGRASTRSRIPSLLGSTSGSPRAVGRRVPLGRTPGTTAAGRAARQALGRLTGATSRHGGRGAFRPFLGRGPSSQSVHAAVGSARGAVGRSARRARAHGRALNSEWTGAAHHLASRGGRGLRRASRYARGLNDAWTSSAQRVASGAGRRIAHTGGRLARWADRRTGHLASGGWSALVRGDQQTWDALRGAYRRWDAQALFGLLTITEWATRGLRGRWAAWRKRRNPDTSEETPTPASPPTTPPRLIVTGPRQLYRRNISMSGLILPGGIVSPLVAMSAEMVSGVARFLPPDMWWVASDLDQLDSVTGNVAAALRTYSRNLAVGYPIDQRIVDMFDEYANTVGKTSDFAMAIASAFKQIHADDIKRRVTPRTNEHLWNV